MALHEWHLTPDHINNEFSEEMLALLIKLRNVRMIKESRRTKTSESGIELTPQHARVPEEVFFTRHNIKVKEL